MKIRIYSPPFHTASGGIRVLHYLGYLAHKLGHIVDMGSNILNPQWGNYHEPFNDDADLHIHPEIDPATEPGKNVVRWVLYFPGVLAGPSVYPEHEMVWFFQEEYAHGIQPAPHESHRFFFLPFVDLPGLEELVERDLPYAAWQGKGPRAPWPAEAEVIDRGHPSTRRGLVRLLKRTQTLYSCDRFTAINQEAQICGCQVRLWTGHDWRPWSDTTAEKFVLSESEALRRVSLFLEVCQHHFGVKDDSRRMYYDKESTQNT